MILILSSSDDISTQHVIDWLAYNNLTYIRVNEDTLFECVEISFGEKGLTCTFQIQDQLVKLENIKAYWYRRGLLTQNIPISGTEEWEKQIAAHLSEEWESLSAFIHWRLKQIPCINGFMDEIGNNKLINLYRAQSCGLKVPDYKIITTRDQLKEVLSQESPWIMKGIAETIFFTYEDKQIPTSPRQYVSSLTSVLDQKEEAFAQDTFFPTFVQKMIEKEIEIRVFYLHKQVYAMAIFSQLAESSSIDSRNEAFDHQLRYVPYLLPDELHKNIQCFMEKSKLTCGSLDFILDTEGTYWFLEINPVGQFDYLSSYCNFNLEKKIAQKLHSLSTS